MTGKKLIQGLALGLTLQGLAAFGSDQGPSRVVYVESNIATPNGNSILAFHREDNGALSPLPGSPFLTGGTGFVDSNFALGPFDSDQNIATNPEHTLLFAVNGGSNSISVFHIHANGTLLPVEGSPFKSYGVQPVSLGFDNGILTVVNKHQDPAQAMDQDLPNYTAFQVNWDGKLTHIHHSTASVAYGSSPSQALAHNGLLFGADFMGGLLQSFSINGGALRQNTPQELPDSEYKGSPAPHFPLGLAAHPNSPALYVGFVTIGKVGVYTYDSYGRLTFLRTVPNSGVAVCWLATNYWGNRLYTTNTGDHSMSVYGTSDAYHPVEIQKIVLNAVGGLFQFSLDQKNEYAFALEQRDKASIPAGKGNALHVLKIDPMTGKLQEVTAAVANFNLPGDTRPQGVLAL